MATKEAVVQAFLNRQKLSGSNLYSVNRKMINYTTTIAEIIGNMVLVSDRKYSSTTTRNQNLIVSMAKDMGYNVEMVSHEELN